MTSNRPLCTFGLTVTSTLKHYRVRLQQVCEVPWADISTDRAQRSQIHGALEPGSRSLDSCWTRSGLFDAGGNPINGSTWGGRSLQEKPSRAR